MQGRFIALKLRKAADTVYYDRHTAELIISFAISAVVPVSLSGVIGQLLLKWIASTMPVMEIIGQTITPDFVESNHPVFSSRDWGHFTLANHSAVLIGGRQVTCVNGCNDKLRASRKKVSNRSAKWTVTCPGCKFQATYREPEDRQIEDRDKGKVLHVPHQSKYMRTPYPIERKTLQWKRTTQGSNPNPSLPPVDRTSGTRPLAMLQPPPATVSRVRSEGSLSSTTKRSRAPSPPKIASTGAGQRVQEGGSPKRKRAKVQNRECWKLSFLSELTLILSLPGSSTSF